MAQLTWNDHQFVAATIRVDIVSTGTKGRALRRTIFFPLATTFFRASRLFSRASERRQCEALDFEYKLGLIRAAMFAGVP